MTPRRRLLAVMMVGTTLLATACSAENDAGGGSPTAQVTSASAPVSSSPTPGVTGTSESGEPSDPDEPSGSSTPTSPPTSSRSATSTPPTASSPLAAASTTPSLAPSQVPVPATLTINTIATGLTTPWGLDFLPDGTALVTERDTAVVKAIAPDGTVSQLGTVGDVAPGGEGGLLGLAVSPDFGQDSTVFVHYTSSADNKVAALTVRDGEISDQRIILDGLPRNSTHNGGRITFGTDGYLYVGTGDAQNRPPAQDPAVLGGKILRIDMAGNGADGNPFPDSPLVYSIGHRNVQGLAFDDHDRLWASEFGQNTWDELNLIEIGGNYGWPIVEGPSDDPGYVAPQQVWSTDDASPSGIAILGGSVWMAGLRGERLWQIPITDSGAASPVAHLVGEYGRLRTVVVAPDGSLWLTTSNTDGRGDVRDGDDQILRIAVS